MLSRPHVVFLTHACVCNGIVYVGGVTEPPNQGEHLPPLLQGGVCDWVGITKACPYGDTYKHFALLEQIKLLCQRGSFLSHWLRQLKGQKLSNWCVILLEVGS